MTRSIIENARDHEVLLALNGVFPEAVDALRNEFEGLVPPENIRVWRPHPSVSQQSSDNDRRRQAAQLYREGFLACFNPDVVHVTSLFEGLSDDAVVSVPKDTSRYLTSVTLYDLIPHIHRETYLGNAVTAAWYDDRLSDLRRADLLVGISHSSCAEAIDYLGCDASRVIAAGTAADSQFKVRTVPASRTKELARRYGLKRSIVMYTGGIDHRKNIERLIEAFGQLPRSLQRQHQLAIVCSVQKSDEVRLVDLARSAGLPADALVLTGYVPEDDLIDLYNMCRLFVFPSWHEGFGLPALEAMSCGAPTIASDRSSLPEVIGRSDALFDPFDPVAIADAMRRALENEELRKDLVDHALTQSARFSWSEVGRRTVESFEESYARRASEITGNSARRRRLAFCSPLPPSRSGIADVSKEILPRLSAHYSVDAVVDDGELVHVADPAIHRSVERVIGHTQFLQEARSYDRVIYNLGNSAFHLWMFETLKTVPGAVILHDFFLSAAVRHRYFVEGDTKGWARDLYNQHGPTPLVRSTDPDQAELVLKDYPCNISILEDALGVIVHSDYAKTLAVQWLNRFEVERWCRARLPRDKAPSVSKGSARETLGIGNEEFLVCSFGLLNPFKHSDRLVRAFAKSKLAKIPSAQLVFVGGASDEQRTELLKLAGTLGVRGKVSITGWTSPEDYGHYLSATDVAVQLRTDSRGETSAAVLDCLNYGIPTIVNANGAMAELPSDAVVMLSDAFEARELVGALNRLYRDHGLRTSLGQQGRAYVEREHALDVVAESYKAAVERIYSDPKKSLLEKLSGAGGLSKVDALRSARAVAELFNGSRNGTIYLDVSVLALHDAKSGIQRVVRNLLTWLVKDAEPGSRFEPIYFDQQNGRFLRAATFVSQFFKTNLVLDSDPVAQFQPGDIYVALDLAHHHALQAQSILADERRRGLKLCYVVYDLLPIQSPELFPDGVSDLHSRWLDVVAEADQAICISRAVADELIEELGKRARPSERPLEVTWFHLGANVDEELAEDDPDGEAELVPTSDEPTFLIVGTIEPRKGHRDVLDAFESLWRAGVDCRLVIVGKRGWKMDDFISRLQTHPKLGRRLFWLEQISDTALKQLYALSDCLIAASHGEGFGLPIVEATLHGKPVIARDIPVFREVAPAGTCFFGGSSQTPLADAIKKWLGNPDRQRLIEDSTVLDWRQSAADFREAIRSKRPYRSIGHADQPTPVDHASRLLQTSPTR